LGKTRYRNGAFEGDEDDETPIAVNKKVVPLGATARRDNQTDR
jgi:hypothetical protein